MTTNRLHIAYMFGGMNRGGAETIMLDLFRNHQHAPYAFIGIHRKDGAYKEAFYNAGPKLVQLAPNRFGYLWYLLKLRRLLKAEGITVVHAQHWLDCIYAWLATIGMHVQIVNTFHGFYSMKGIAGWLCRMSIRMADDVCFVSKYEQDWYQQQVNIAEEKCHVIFNAVDLGKLDKVESRESRVDSGLKIEDRRLKNENWRLAMVGSFSPARNQLLICKAIHEVEQKFEFYFIGAPNEHISNCYQECYDYCKLHELLDRVHFVGEQSNVYEWLKDMDGFVYATKHDTFGIAQVEAMAMGIPSVVSDWPVMKEICAPFIGKSVQLFGMEDAQDCAKKISDLLNHLNEYKNEAQKNSDEIKKMYSIEAYISRLLTIYN